MSLTRRLTCMVTGLVIAGYVPLIGGIDWTYEDEANWAPLCHEGKHQSPTALSPYISESSDFPAFVMTGYGEPMSMVLKNNGHSAEVRPNKDEERPEVYGGGLPTTYQLDHLHFHWQSEHTVKDIRFPLELHLVHYVKEYHNLTNALRYPEGVAVFAVLFHLSPDDDMEFEPLIRIVDTVKTRVNQPVPWPGFVVKHFLPRDVAGYYRYDGSLTTPGCNEGIIWTIFTETIPISDSQVKVFEQIHTATNTVLRHNYRSLQPLNDRKLYHKISPIGVNGEGSRIKVATLTLFLLSTIMLQL